jgi:hypothetical protein
MASPPFAVLLLLLALPACVSTPPNRDPEAAERLSWGLEALAERDYDAAYEDLSWVLARQPRTEDGRRATLVLAAAELDPRNPRRRPDVGADLTARYLADPLARPWIVPIAETVYLLARELGAPPPTGTAAQDAPDRELPVLPGPSIAEELQRASTERDSLAGRVTELEGLVAALELRLAERDQEIARIRRALRP